jgi:hypothetical protein
MDLVWPLSPLLAPLGLKLTFQDPPNERPDMRRERQVPAAAVSRVPLY